MSSGPKNVTSTSSNEPPAFLRGPLTQGVNAASSQFNSQTGGTGSQLLGQGQGVVSDTLQGNYLNPDSNPYLKNTFNRAADLTRTRLASEFAGSGRDLSASAPARSDELQTLASNIYGGNYQAERDRQQNAVGQARSLDPLNMFIDRLGGIIPGAGGTSRSTQPVYKTGLF
jgi:hypothetical protein